MIEYRGIERFDNDWLSVYFLGVANTAFCRSTFELYKSEYFVDQNRAKLDYLMVRKFIKTADKVMYAWFEQNQFPFGGNVVTEYGEQYMYLLLKPKSIEELAFRLCFDVSS